MRLVSENQTHDPLVANSLVELASGVDAFYLSGRSILTDRLKEVLRRARETAEEFGRATVISVGSEELKVSAHGFGRYRYHLAHKTGTIGLTESRKIPTVRVQPRAEFLHAIGPSEVLAYYQSLLRELLGTPVSWGLSRMDLFCDVQEWELRAEDRHNFVCQAKGRTTRESDKELETLEFGRRATGTVCARIYDKTKQIESKGLDWWHRIWGEQFNPSRPVHRIEFEFGRQGLVELGVDTPEDGLNAVGGLWGYATTWLSYRTPAPDQTQSRWPEDPVWAQVRQASLRGTADGLDRIRAGSRKGDIRLLMPALVGYLARAGAAMNQTDLDSTLGAVRHLVLKDQAERGVLFCDRLADKREQRGLP